MKKTVAALVCIIFVSSLVLIPFASADWAMFRANPSNDGVGTGNPVLTPTLLWNFTTGGGVSSSPIVVGNMVYVGSGDGNVYALNVTNGVQLWNSSGSSPAVANGVVYVGTGFTVNALNATNGAQLWSEYPIYDTYLGLAPYVVTGGVVYCSTTQTSGLFFAFNAKTGNELWSKSITPYEFWSSPAVVNGVLYVGTEQYATGLQSPLNGVYALNAKSGAQIWNYSSSYSVEASPVVVEGIVYFVTYEGDLYALNAENGVQIWNSTVFGVGDSSPAIVDGVIYIRAG